MSTYHIVSFFPILVASRYKMYGIKHIHTFHQRQRKTKDGTKEEGEKLHCINYYLTLFIVIIYVFLTAIFVFFNSIFVLVVFAILFLFTILFFYFR